MPSQPLPALGGLNACLFWILSPHRLNTALSLGSYLFALIATEHTVFAAEADVGTRRKCGPGKERRLTLCNSGTATLVCLGGDG
jgi:hypothetical protein